MNWFRQTLREHRVIILTVLTVNVFYMTEGTRFVYAYQVYEQKEARLKEISEFLDIPVERLRPDHEGLFDSIKKLFVDEVDPVKAAGLKRLQEVLRKHEEQVASNPYLHQIEEVKREHAVYRIEGVIQDLMQLTQPRGGKALPEPSQRAILRNLHHALREDLMLPLPEGLPAKAQAKHAEMQAKLDRLFDSVRPVVAETQGEMKGTLAQKIAKLSALQEVETRRPTRPPRFADRPLPLRWVEKKVRSEEVSVDGAKPARRVPAKATPSAPPVEVVNKDGIAPELIELAESLGNSPARILAYVHDNIDFDPKWGAAKPPLGTLWEKSGTSWEQAWLLRDLLTAAGVDARFEWGEIEVPTELITNLTGLDDPWRAGDLLTTAGVPIVLLTQGGEVIGARMSHVWVKGWVDYIPNRGATPGPGDYWIVMDPSLKRYAYTEGIPVHEEVQFSLGEYLQSGTVLSPRRAYEEALWAYIRANNLDCTTLEQLKRAPSVIREDFPFLPSTLRGKILQIDGGATAIPDAYQQRVQIEVRRAGSGSRLAWESFLPALYGHRIEIAYQGATADDAATLASYGGIFATPPYLVDLKPVLTVTGVEQAGTAIGAAEEVEIFVTTTSVGGVADVFVHDGFAGEPSVVITAFSRGSQRLLGQFQEQQADAFTADDETGTESATLQLLGATYLHNLGRDVEDIASWSWHRLVRMVSEGLVVQTGNATATVGGAPLTFAKAETFVDFAGFVVGLFHTTGDSCCIRPTLELAGSQGSYLEGEVFDNVLAREGIAAISALTRAQREGQAVQQVDALNVDAVLAATDLGEDVESQVRHAVAQGRVAWLSEASVAVNQWQGVGYVLADPSTGAAAYLLSGGFAGGAETEEAGAAVQGFLGNESWLTSNPIGRRILSVIEFFAGGSPGQDGPSTNNGDPINLASGNLLAAVHGHGGPGAGNPDLLGEDLQQPQHLFGPFRVRLDF